MGRYVNRYPYGAYSSRFYEKKERRRKVWKFIGWGLLFSAQTAVVLFLIVAAWVDYRYRVPTEEELGTVSGRIEAYEYVERRISRRPIVIRYCSFVLENGEEYRLREPVLDSFPRGLFEGQVKKGDEILLRVDRTKSLFYEDARIYEIWKGSVCYLGYEESRIGYEWGRQEAKRMGILMVVFWTGSMIPLDVLLWRRKRKAAG